MVTVGGNASHGMAVTPDSKTLVVNSRLNSAVYSYSLPDLKLIGTTEIAGIDPNWVTLTPDGKAAYVAIAGSNFVAAIDVKSMKQVARIPVTQPRYCRKCVGTRGSMASTAVADRPLCCRAPSLQLGHTAAGK